jgi:hypothetical protein
MSAEDLRKELLRVIDELEIRFKEGTVGLKEMVAYVEKQGIAHLDGYLRRCGALDYQSPKRFFQQGVDLEIVRKALKKSETPRGLEGLLGGAEGM